MLNQKGKIKKSVVLLALSLLIVLAGCGGGTPSPSGDSSANGNSGAAPKVLVYGLNAEPQSIDPINSTGAGELKIIRNAYDALVQEKHGSVELEPALAVSWTEEGGRIWTFKLREGVKFQDGTAFNAEAVKFSIERVQKLGGGIGSLISNVEAVEAPETYTAVIKLKSPDVNFLYNLAKIVIVSPTAAKEHEQDNDLGKAWLSRHTAGTGPYQVSEWVEGQYAQLDRFTDYWKGWEDSDHQLDQIKFQFVSDPSTQYQLLERGEVDKIEISIVDIVDRLEKNGNLTVLKDKSLETDIFTFNTAKAPLNNKKFRQAISYAMDYESVAKSVLKGYGTVPRGFLAEGFEGFNEKIPPQTYDLEKAKQLLAESGVTQRSLTLHIMSGLPIQKNAAGILQDSLRQIGIDLKIEEKPWATLYEEHAKSETAPDMSVLNMGAFTGDPVTFLAQNFHSRNIGGPYNWSFWSNPDFDKLLDQAAATADKTEKNKLLAKAQEILVEDAPAIYFANPGKVEAINSRFTGYVLHPLDYYYTIWFYDLRVKE